MFPETPLGLGNLEDIHPWTSLSLAPARRETERERERERESAVTTPGVTAAEMYGNCTRLTYRDSAACGRRECLPVVSLAQHPPADTRRKLARKPARVNSIPRPDPRRATAAFPPTGGWMQPTPGDVESSIVCLRDAPVRLSSTVPSALAEDSRESTRFRKRPLMANTRFDFALFLRASLRLM